MTNPSDPQRNLHHTLGYRSQEDFYEDMFGKGSSDPDFHGHPGEAANAPFTPTVLPTDLDDTKVPF